MFSNIGIKLKCKLLITLWILFDKFGQTDKNTGRLCWSTTSQVHSVFIETLKKSNSFSSDMPRFIFVQLLDKTISQRLKQMNVHFISLNLFNPHFIYLLKQSLMTISGNPLWKIWTTVLFVTVSYLYKCIFPSYSISHSTIPGYNTVDV